MTKHCHVLLISEAIAPTPLARPPDAPIQADLIQSPRILAKAMIGGLGRLHFRCWKSDGSLTSNRLGNPVSQVTSSHCSRRLRYLPLCTNVPSTSILVPNNVLTDSRCDPSDGGRLGRARTPACDARHDRVPGRHKSHICEAAHGIAGAGDRVKTLGCDGQKRFLRQGRLASHEKRPESAIRKYGRCFGIGKQQRVIASAQFGLTNDVE